MEIQEEMTREDEKHVRCYFRRVAGIGLAAAGLIVFLISVAVSTRAHAEEIPLHVLEKDGIQIRLMNLPCVDPMSIMMVKPEVIGRFKGLQSSWPQQDGTLKEFQGCWADLTAQEAGGEESFLVVFSDGESGVIPKSEFKKVKGQSGA